LGKAIGVDLGGVAATARAGAAGPRAASGHKILSIRRASARGVYLGHRLRRTLPVLQHR